MGRLLIDVEPLRKFPQFRRLWTGYLFRQLGAQIAVTTVIYQIFVITHSNLAVGLLSLAQLGPAILFPLFGGAIADAIDRRVVLVVTAVFLALCSVGLAFNAMSTNPSLWLLYLLSSLTWGAAGIDAPTRTAATMALVDREHIVSANVLRQLLGATANMVGPGVAGILIAVFHGHLAPVYWIDVASTLAALQAVLRLPPLRPVGGGTKFSTRSIREGFGFLRFRPVIKSCFVADLFATVLGQPTSLFPYMALVHFDGGPGAFGLLSAAPFIGAGLGGILSGWTRNVRHQGRAVLIAVTVWGVALIGFGLAPTLWLGVLFVVIAGWADAASALFRTTILQLEVPDRLRGRISSFQSIVVQTGPRLGNLEGGLVAALTSAPFAIVSGGAGCVAAMAFMARRQPSFRSYDINTATGEEDPAFLAEQAEEEEAREAG